MTMRLNSQGQVESVKTRPVEHVSVVESRQEILDELGRAQAEVVEITQDLAEYDAVVASQTAAPEAPAEPAAPEAPQAPVAPADGGAQ